MNGGEEEDAVANGNGIPLPQSTPRITEGPDCIGGCAGAEGIGADCAAGGGKGDLGMPCEGMNG